MKFQFCFLFFCLVSFSGLTQNIWTATSTSDATSEGLDVVIDSQGNSYMIGYISGDTEFHDIQVDITTGYSDVVVAKINPDGIYQWVKRFSGPLSDKGIKIALTPSNELIIAGTFYTSIDIAGTILQSTAQSKDLFIAKLNLNGDVIWARKEGGSMSENVYALEVDQQNNIIISGQFEGNSTIGNQTFSSMIDPDLLVPSFDIFLAKYDQNGVPIWAKAAYAPYEDRGLALVCDAQNNIYLSGQFSEDIDFFGQTIQNQIVNAGFVAKFAPDGGMSWFNKLAAAQVLAYDLTMNNQQELLVTGDYLGQLVVWAQNNQFIVTNPYFRKVFVLKLTNSGNFTWGKAIGSNSEVTSRTICTDSQNNIYIGGNFKCNFDEYRDSTGTSHWQSVGFRDQFVSKFNNNGGSIWKNQIGGQRDDQLWGMDIKDSDYPIITGSFATNMVFPFDSDFAYANYITNETEQAYFFNFNEGLWTDNVEHLPIIGDESINIHVSKMISSHSAYYNYYEGYSDSNYDDSLEMFIIPDTNFVHFCPDEAAYFYSFTNHVIGPLYSGLWNTGDSMNVWQNYNQQDGQYSISVNRIDNCYFVKDTITIDYHPYPNMPLLTDNFGINQQDAYYSDVQACFPDSLMFHFQQTCTACSTTISISGLLNNQPLVYDSTYTIDYEAGISVKTISEFGCENQESFLFELDKDIEPFLILEDFHDHNDSISICQSDFVRVYISDSLINPNFDFIHHEENVENAGVFVTHNGQPVSSETDGQTSVFYPETSGWYVVNQQVTVGNEDCPFPHTITDSFYVKIEASPSISLVGGELLCPDSYNFLSYSPIVENAVWYGPAILWTSADGDSIKLNESGWYGISGQFQYEEVTCQFNIPIFIDEKEAPSILMNPVDGIVCPGDSVHLYLSEVGLAYEWIGPEGFTISHDASIYGIDQGFYACLFTDLDGCQLLTPQAEIKEYATPFLELSPSHFICEQEDISISAIFGGNANVQWHQPLSGNASQVTVNQAGVYICSISQCGITVVDSVEIIDASFELPLNFSDTNICAYDTLRLETTPGLVAYLWSPNSSGSYFLNTAEPGSYFVQAWNEFGCTAISPSVQIEVYEDSYLPVINDTFVCIGGAITYNTIRSFHSNGTPILNFLQHFPPPTL